MSDLPDNVVILPCVTTLPLDPDMVLKAAVGQKLKRVLIIGVTEEEEDFYFSSSQSDGGTCLWDMEKAKLKLLGIL